MILAVDIGNTHIVLGALHEDSEEIAFTSRISSDHRQTSDEYMVLLHNLFILNGFNLDQVEGCILSSVVPGITPPFRLALEKLSQKQVLVVGSGVKTGLNILIDNPAQLGSDMVVMAVAAAAAYPKPVLIFDLSTATTLSVLDEKGGYLGGMIMPGPKIGMDALSNSTAQLPHISFEAPKRLIGTNTIDCMKSGYTYGTAAMLDGIVQRVESKLGKKTSVIATGALAQTIVPFCKHNVIFDADLRLKGLRLIYLRNCPKQG